MSHKEQCVLPLFMGEKHGGFGFESDLCSAENMMVTEHEENSTHELYQVFCSRVAKYLPCYQGQG